MSETENTNKYLCLRCHGSGEEPDLMELEGRIHSLKDQATGATGTKRSHLGQSQFVELHFKTTPKSVPVSAVVRMDDGTSHFAKLRNLDSTRDAGAPEPQTCADAAAMNPFKVGDRVRLKSETRWMTVLADCCCDPECGWVDRWGEHHCEAFPAAALTKFAPEDDIPF